MDKPIKKYQRRLNLELENLLDAIKEENEIEFARNYIKSFENQGYDVRYFKRRIEFIKVENYLFKSVKNELIKSIDKNLLLN
jgi:hypothetical protein